MNRKSKLLLYISIPIFFGVSIFLFNRFVLNGSTVKNVQQIEHSQSTQRRERGGLPVSNYVAQKELKDDGFVRLGNLLPREKVDVVSELSGRVTEINFKEGEFVKKGHLLVKLDDQELQVQLNRANYQLLLVSQRLERQKILLEKDAVSREDFDKVLTDYNVLTQDIEQLKIRIEKMHIRAPFNGVVGLRDVSIGAFLQPNSKITTLVDIENLIVEVSIPEKYLSNSLTGSKLNFSVEGYVDDFYANIYAVDPMVDTRTRTITVRASYINRNLNLRPGMSARVSLRVVADQESIYIPNQAIVPDVKGRSVWLVKNSKAVSVPVKIGNRSADMIEIVSGVELGDSVITTGLLQLRNGIVVNPIN